MYVHGATGDATIDRPLDTPNIRRQVKRDPFPPLISQPKQVLAYDPNSHFQRESESYCQPQELMSSDPSLLLESRRHCKKVADDERKPLPNCSNPLCRSDCPGICRSGRRQASNLRSHEPAGLKSEDLGRGAADRDSSSTSESCHRPKDTSRPNRMLWRQAGVENASANSDPVESKSLTSRRAHGRTGCANSHAELV
jgi:hypothetical protein